jgi:hypothetical protein
MAKPLLNELQERLMEVQKQQKELRKMEIDLQNAINMLQAPQYYHHPNESQCP